MDPNIAQWAALADKAITLGIAFVGLMTMILTVWFGPKVAAKQAAQTEAAQATKTAAEAATHADDMRLLLGALGRGLTVGLLAYKAGNMSLPDAVASAVGYATGKLVDVVPKLGADNATLTDMATSLIPEVLAKIEAAGIPTTAPG